jgi:hypothetical protein
MHLMNVPNVGPSLLEVIFDPLPLLHFFASLVMIGIIMMKCIIAIYAELADAPPVGGGAPPNPWPLTHIPHTPSGVMLPSPRMTL